MTPVVDAVPDVDVTSVNDAGYPDTITLYHPRPDEAVRAVLAALGFSFNEVELMVANPRRLAAAGDALAQTYTGKAAGDLADHLADLDRHPTHYDRGYGCTEDLEA